VSRVDLDGRKIDFRLVREDEELLARAMKEKGVAPIVREGVPVKASAKRAAKKAAGKAKKSPLDAVKAAAKKAAGKTRAARKSRR
jgi:ribonuclease R